MDLASIIGLAAGMTIMIVSILMGGSIFLFINIPSVLIVVGGTIASTLINYPLGDVIGVLRVVKKAFLHREENPTTVVQLLVKFAETARREGILSLEQQVAQVQDDFLRTGINLAVDGTEPEHIRDIMETEISYISERHKSGAGLFEAMAMYAPAFGMIGTLIGLVQMLANMSDPSTIGPSMAVALITTFYGAVMANLIFLPIAGKLKQRSASEVLTKELCVEGIMSIQSGDNPRIVEDKLKAFIAPTKRGPKRDEGA